MDEPSDGQARLKTERIAPTACLQMNCIASGTDDSSLSIEAILSAVLFSRLSSVNLLLNVSTVSGVRLSYADSWAGVHYHRHRSMTSLVNGRLVDWS